MTKVRQVPGITRPERADSPRQSPSGPHRDDRRKHHRKTPPRPFVWYGRVLQGALALVGWTLSLILMGTLVRKIWRLQTHHLVVTWISVDLMVLAFLWVWLSSVMVLLIHEMGHVMVAMWAPRTGPIRITWATVLVTVVTIRPCPMGNIVRYRQRRRNWGRVQAGWRHWSIIRQVAFLLAGNGIVLVVSGLGLIIGGSATNPFARWGCLLVAWVAALSVAGNSGPWPGRKRSPDPGRNGYRWRLRQDGTRLWYLRPHHPRIDNLHQTDAERHPSGKP